MMDVAMKHFNRAASVLALCSAATTVSAQLPGGIERLRATPELSGRLTYQGKPIADARIAIILNDSTRPPGCASRSVVSTNDSGVFKADATWRWFSKERMAALRRGTLRHEFYLCAQLKGQKDYRALFQAPANRWDTLRLACDLDRPWLPPDLEGRQGYCSADAAVDHAYLAAPPAGSRSPDVTCNTKTAVIERLRVGPVRINGSIAELRRLCPALRDTVIKGDGWMEPQAQRALVLTIGGVPVIVHPASGIVAQITIRSRGLTTADSIGVGTRVSRLRRRKDLYVVGGNAEVLPFATAWLGEECGVGFYTTQPSPNQLPSLVSPKELRTWPDSMAVRRVIVGFCPDHGYRRFLKH